MPQNKNLISLASLTFLYSLLLAAIMQAAHTLTRVALSVALAIATADILNPSTILGELVNKVGWSVFACEAVVLLSVLAQRRWILLIAVAAASVFVGSLLGQYLRVLVENAFGRVTAFLWESATGTGMLLSSRYVFVGAGLAWANHVAQAGLRHYLGAGLAAAICASLVTLIALNADPNAKLGIMAVDFVFPIGCTAVVWKVKQLADPLIAAHRETKTMLRNI